MSKQEFNWDAFSKALQGNSYICRGAHEAIENAIKAGKGEVILKTEQGQVWKHTDSSDRHPYRLITADGGAVALDDRAAKYTASDIEYYRSTGKWAFAADSLSSHFATGGKI